MRRYDPTRGLFEQFAGEQSVRDAPLLCRVTI
jgi:hypothetical protein